MSNVDIIMFDEVKKALTHYTYTHEGFNLLCSGNRLFSVCKDTEGNVSEALDIYFKKDSIENVRTMTDWLKGANNNLYPINICYMEKFDALGRGEISRYNDDGTLNDYLKDGSVIKNSGLREIYVELATETDKGYLLEHGLTSFVEKSNNSFDVIDLENNSTNKIKEQFIKKE